MNHIQSPDHSDAGIEREILAKGLTAPRVTPADIEAAISGEHYFTASEGVIGHHSLQRGELLNAADYKHQALQLLTFCVLVLRNGFTVTGESAPASPENFDAEVGRKIARQNAVNKLWPLLGYALKERLTGPDMDGMVERFLSWPVPSSVHPDGASGQEGRTGTNLLSAAEARDMLQHVMRTEF